MKLFRKSLAAIASLLLATAPMAALAAPLPYINTPMDTINAGLNTVIQSVNGQVQSQYATSCTGTTTATCQGLRLFISTTGLSTADGGTLSAQITVTDASVTAASEVVCGASSTTGTGAPIPVSVVPGAGSFTFYIANVSGSAALSATVITPCVVYN